jgi:hypothetical protein
MLGIIAAKSSFYKKHTAPYLNIVKALLSSAKNDGWKIVSQKGSVNSEQGKLIATAIVKYFNKIGETTITETTITKAYDITRCTVTEVFRLHSKAGASMTEAIGEGVSCKASMVISDSVFGNTFYETYISGNFNNILENLSD